MIVLDASGVVELPLVTPAGRRVSSRIATRGERLHAPHPIDLEIAQVLRRYGASAQISERRAREALQDLSDLDLDLNRYPHDVLLPRIWELRDNVTAYDGAYLALVEVLGATLLTCDEVLGRVPGVGSRVEVV